MSYERDRQAFVHPPGSEHITELVELPFGHREIDTEMVPLICWMNSLPGVHTLACCQGTDDDASCPYVLFECDNMESLKKIVGTLVVNRLSTWVVGHCLVDCFDGYLRYDMRFGSRRNFQWFCESFQEKVNE